MTIVDALSCDPVPFGGNHAIILSRSGRYQATTGLTYDYMNERFHKWGEWQLRSSTDLLLEFATILAVGGRCFFADQPYPAGDLEPEVYRRLRPAYDFVRQREPFVRDAVMTPEVAILASGPSQLFGPIGSGLNASRTMYGPVGNQQNAARTDRVEGAHLAMVELGVNCLIYDEPTLRENLSEQKAVVIPEQCLLEDATIHALTDFVERGGSLLVTGRSGWWDERYRRRQTPLFDELAGIRTTGNLASPIHYVRTRKGLGFEDDVPDMPIQCWGTATQVEPVDAVTLADLFGPLDAVWRDGVQDADHWQHHTVMGACPPGVKAVAPAITVRRLGEGRVMYMAVDPFASYRHDGHHLARLLIKAMMEVVLPAADRLVSADKPTHVEIATQRQGERLVVHLLNFFAQKRTALLVHNEEITPVFNITLRIKSPEAPRKIMQQPEGIEIEHRYADGVITIAAPRLDIHTMIVIE
ncbi:MAG: beta-galactosidase trimerization domain-containing protein [Caldilineales bacterium]|nr:beta-galactosidase trimerization domain-containing protein [Caldilineales bacterium]